MKVLFLIRPGASSLSDIVRGFLEQLCSTPISTIETNLPSAAPGEVFLREYRQLVAHIEDILASTREDVGIWLPLSLANLISPTDPSNGFESLCAMLILSFPEVHWMPLSSSDGDENWSSEVPATPDRLAHLAHQVALLNLQCSPIFDGQGIRNHVRDVIREGSASDSQLAVRSRVAAAIDEETDCAVTHAYTAYRFGFRTHVITTYGLLEYLFKDIPPRAFPEPLVDSAIVFEDVCLNFPDRKIKGFSLLKTRDNELPGLRASHSRIFVTSGLAKGHEEENAVYIDGLRSSHKVIKKLDKPISGIFDLGKATGVSTTHGSSGWEAIPTSSAESSSESSHSAPGRLLVVADVLIRRAERLLSDTQSVVSSIHGAVLAGDALELLGGRTPTTSLKALTLKHQFEVLAECHSHGVANNFDVKSRLTELGNDITKITNLFPTDKRRSSQLNAEITAVGRLVQVFRDHYQFDEEQVCLVRVRNLHREKYELENSWAKLWRPLSWYTNFLLGSLANFCLGLAVTALVFAGLFEILGYPPPAGSPPLGNAMQTAILTFLALQPETYNVGIGHFFLVTVTILAGLFHFGVLVSHVYAIVARR